MAGYVYTKMKEALYGSSTVSKYTGMYSPNIIKCLIIGKDFIFVGYHTRQSRIVRMDYQQVCQDMTKVNTGFINNLFAGNKLNCLEEIYVDYAYKDTAYFESSVFNIEQFAKSLIDTGRIRYYGYISLNCSIEDVAKVFNSAITNHNYVYTLCGDRSLPIAIGRKVCNDEDWYKRHIVQPDSYKVDAELKRFFDRVDSTVESLVKQALEEQNSAVCCEYIDKLVKIDNSYLDDLRYFCFALHSAKTNSAVKALPWVELFIKMYDGVRADKNYKVENIGAMYGTEPELVKLVDKFLCIKGSFSAKELDGIENNVIILKSLLDSGNGCLGIYPYMISLFKYYLNNLSKSKKNVAVMALCMQEHFGKVVINPESQKACISELDGHQLIDFYLHMMFTSRDAIDKQRGRG